MAMNENAHSRVAVNMANQKQKVHEKIDELVAILQDPATSDEEKVRCQTVLEDMAAKLSKITDKESRKRAAVEDARAPVQPQSQPQPTGSEGGATGTPVSAVHPSSHGQGQGPGGANKPDDNKDKDKNKDSTK